MHTPCFARGPSPWLGARTLAWLAGAALFSSAVSAAEPGLGLLEAGRLALERQPQLTAQAAMVSSLQENAVAARQLPDPKLILGVEGVPVDSFSLTRQEMTQTVIGFSQAIPGGDKLALAGRRLEQEAGQNRLLLAAGERRIARDARLAWLEAYWPTAAGRLLAEIEAEYTRQVEWSEVAYKTGQLSQAETLAMRAMLAETRNRRAELAGQQRRGQAALARWLGAAANRPLAALPDQAPPPSLTELEARLTEHPELAALRQGVEAARTDTQLARQAYRPDWSVDLSYGIRGNDRADTVKLMVGVDLPLFPGKRQDRRLAARHAELNQQEAMLEDRRRMLEADLRMAYADWQVAHERLERIEREILPLAARRVDSALAAYRSNQASFDRVIEARRAEAEARLEHLTQAVAQARAATLLTYFE
ncbi:outer membrane protein TolC [Sulfuritortus calidifontis]|uniref:Outer membrane protein TolC n=1 Tax=Sulfuritortus calidifontis TaxID=1914471 RepID=A0A4R3JR05_9PROT|nr:TolC family protein [Sulfuritortus calidifontis]TCS69441.1 outer membrane protein TolC [Sulfuritortus calidifontis]